MDTNRRIAAFTGILYTVAALFGLVISVGGLILLWSTRAEVTRSVGETVDLYGRALGATSQTIEVVNGSLDQASDNLALIHAMAVDMALTLDDSQGLIDATAGMIGSDLAGFFEETQSSLEEVEASARTVDEALVTIDSIRSTLDRVLDALNPFSTTPPEEPLPRARLQESVAEVRRSLDPVSGSLGEIERQLSVSAANVAAMQAEIEQLAGEVAEIETSLESARNVASEYRAILDELQQRFDRFEERLPLAMRVIYLALTLLLVWILMTQAAMLAQGITLLVGRGKSFPQDM